MSKKGEDDGTWQIEVHGRAGMHLYYVYYKACGYGEIFGGRMLEEYPGGGLSILQYMGQIR